MTERIGGEAFFSLVLMMDRTTLKMQSHSSSLNNVTFYFLRNSGAINKFLKFKNNTIDNDCCDFIKLVMRCKCSRHEAEFISHWRFDNAFVFRLFVFQNQWIFHIKTTSLLNT